MGDIDATTFARLSALLDSADFFNLKASAGQNKAISNLPLFVVTAVRGGVRTSVRFEQAPASQGMNTVVRAISFQRLGVDWFKAQAPQDLTNSKISCDVHHLQLQRVVVRIAYGQPLLVSSESKYQQARRHLFPYARYEVQGGCVLSYASPKDALIAVCSKCNAVEALWVKTHDKP